jgi:hypothetical protein
MGFKRQIGDLRTRGTGEAASNHNQSVCLTFFHVRNRRFEVVSPFNVSA